ncbi:poly(3-hydroxybutyrate) depolymerase [Methylotuvimicrobium buryatense]|uniref:Poly(3-hydroxybutyrate) depolymerase n=1 Tax=Methylotuvimicrobium buryatense TaxID=95641 RepID=A0A4P9UNW9_METBY|nr:poly(3-hydroxybutyrate) depolymerase [Methylotuvimicrobium buryatense]QCW83064.1 poly(3-hydroxybutyrate) depolymerase [Methylotuvimicrobium buryatense]
MIDFSTIKPHLTKRNMWLAAIFLPPILLVLIMLLMETGSSDYAQMGNAVYRPESFQGQCQTEQLKGAAGATHGESTADGIKFNVRTPLNYDPTVPHPLLLVLSPAGSNRAKTEKTTDLTLAATTAGMIVAYADHPPLSPTTAVELGTIPELIAKKWCIDDKRIYITGHSDGGTSTMALAFMSGTKHIPSAIAPSAAGINYEELRERRCPDPIPAMIMHSAKDKLFPGYGKESAGWWATCNQCDPIPEPLDNGCSAYTNCANGIKTWYCEGDKPHSQWPNINATLIDFFVSSGRKEK